MTRRTRIRLLLGFTALLLTVTAGVLVFVNSSSFREWLRGQLVTRASAAIDGTLTVGSLEGSLVGDVRLNQVAIEQDGVVVVEADVIEAHYDLWQLLSGNLQIDRVALTRPTVRLLRNAGGWNLARLIRAGDTQPAAAPRTVRISRIDIVDAALVAEVDGNRAASLSALTLEASLAIDAAGVVLDVTRASFIDDVSGLPVSRLEAAVVVGDAGVSIDGIRLEAPEFQLTGQVSIPDDRSAMQLDLRAVLQTWQAGTYRTYVPEVLLDLPAVSGELTAHGPLEAMRTEWNLTMPASASTGALVVNATAPRPELKGRATVRNINPRFFVRREDLDGTITAVLDLDAAIDTAAPLQSQVAFAIADGAAALMGYRADAVRAKGTFSGGVLRASGQVRAYGAQTTATVTIADIGGEGTPLFAAAGRIAGLDVSKLPAHLKAPAITTAIAGAYDVVLDDDFWKVAFTADESSVETATIASGAVVRAEARGTALEASISAGLTNLSSALFGHEDTRPTVLGGQVDASVSIADITRPMDADALNDIDGHVMATIGESVILGTDVTGLDVDASLRGGTLVVRELDVESAAVVLSAQGEVALGSRAAAPSSLVYEIDVADLALLPAEWVTGLRGGAHARGTVTGIAERPATTGEFTLREPGYQEAGHALAVSGTFDAALPDLDVERIVAGVDAEGTFITVGDQQIQSMRLAARYGAQRVDVTARVNQRTRSVELDGQLALLPDYQEVQLRDLTISGLGDPWRLAPGAGTVVRYGADDVQIKGLSFVRGGERVDVAGTIALPDRGDHSDLTVDLAGLNLGDLLTLATGTPSVTGTAGGHMRLTGAIGAPVVDAAVEVVDGTAADVPFTIAKADVRLADRRATIDARVDEPNGSALTAVGVVPVGDEDGAIDLKVVSSNISLGLAAAFTSHVEAIEGMTSFDVHVGGTYAAPVLAGTAALKDAAFTVVPTGVRYVDVVLDVKLDGGTLAIERASLADTDGHVMTLTGGAEVLGVGGRRTVDIRVLSKGIHVLGNELGDVELSIDARAQGNLLAPGITGRVVVDRGRLEVDELLERLGANRGVPIAAAPAAASNAPGPAVPGGTPASTGAVAPVADAAAGAPESTNDVTLAETPASNSTIELEFVLPDNVVLRGRGIRTSAASVGLGDLNLTVGGGFSIRKEAGVPMRLVGAVEVVRGFYEFQGRRFEVAEGSDIRFRGTESMNPTLNVTGVRDVSGITARVEVTGTAANPRITLSSTPPLDEGDVLSLIIFNQPMSQLGQSEQVDLLDRAGDMALGALATSLADSIGRALNVDLFEIRAPSSGGAGEVNLGTQVSDRLFVGFRQEFGAQGASRLSLEYRLTQMLRLLTSVGQGADQSRSTRERETAGVDLVFRLRY